MMIQRVRLRWLLSGDVAAVFVVTMAGFLSHYGMIQDWRWLTTFLPFLAAWLIIAPWLGVYHSDTISQPRQLWRLVLAALFAAPLAATLRGFWLNAAVPPIFVAVLGLTNALGIFIWRLTRVLVVQQVVHRVERQHG